MALSPYRKLHPTAVGSVQWKKGFWGNWFQLSREVILPSMWRALNEPQNGAVFSNFYVAAGLKEGALEGTMWSDGDCYKWMEGMTHVYGVTRDKAILEELDELLEVIALAQEPDGYISSPVQIAEGIERWQDVNNHELYNQGHLMTAASVHHLVTGQDNFLTIATKLADYLYLIFQPRPSELAHFGFNPSNTMGALDLYRTTGNPKYLDLAQTFVDMRGSQPGGPDQNQARIPLREETSAVGHSVTAGYLYCGATDVYAETGEEALLQALERIWQNMVSSKMYITGGNAALHFGTSMRPEFGAESWPGKDDAVHEAFGLEYQLPNAAAYNETCANIANAMWNWRLLGLSGDAKYTEVMERVVYNSMLSSINIEGEHFCYTNPLRWHDRDHQLLTHDELQRWYTHNCYCCPTSTARTITLLHNWVYSQSNDTVWIHLYGSSTLEVNLVGDKHLKLIQETNYPWDGAVKFMIEEATASPITLRLRIPSWATGVTISINGSSIDQSIQPGTYVKLEQKWAAGDVIELSLPMKVRLMKAATKVEEVRNQVAVMRGPIVYCLEGVDLPEGISVSEVHIPHDIQLTPTFEPDLLGGVTVLSGQARRIYEEGTITDLYQEIGAELKEVITIKLIPYFAWNNRGISEMTVWMPRI